MTSSKYIYVIINQKGTTMSLSDIQNMPLEERLYLMEQLWDSFKYEKEIVNPPVWHKDVLSQRLEKYEKGEVELLSLEELKSSL